MSEARAKVKPLKASASETGFSLDDVDLTEQARIHADLASYAESLNEKAIQEALKRSLETDSSTMDNSHIVDAIDNLDIGTDSSNGDTLLARGATAGASGYAAAAASEPDIINLNCDADDESDESDDSSHERSRRGQYQHQQHHKSERRPSLDRINGHASVRSPSPDRMYDRTSERRPSLDRMQNSTSERRPSLERAYQQQNERRPSLERVANARSERRPSLERMANSQAERRPSLERMNNHRTERRPSLERLEQYGLERRPSLERKQNAAQRVQSLAENGASDGSAQGVNTLRPPPLNENKVPTNWDPHQLPELGDGTLYRLVALSPIDREYTAITVDFEEAALKVFSVERLQNLELLERFNREKEHLLRHRPPDFELNERYLYHGTRANQECLCEEGLDFRLSFQGCFGRGTYFSDNPRKCMAYASSSNVDYDSGARPMILVCRVLLGESKIYDHGIKDSDLKRGPEKPRTRGGHKYYDSVQGIPVDYPEFVVYDNSRSMIEYIVKFEEIGYRSPPSQYNFYKNQVPSLYKCEPIVLPIPEKELDELYMLGPDTDSEGSCDEHTREVERLRENVKRGKAKRLGIPFRLPTKEEKRYERLHWKRVCYFSCPPGSPLYDMMIIKKREEKLERKKRKAKELAEKEGGEGAEAILDPKYMDRNYIFKGTAADPQVIAAKYATTDKAEAAEDQFTVESDTVGEVLDSLITDFLSVTMTDDVEAARRYIMENDMDMDRALCQYYREMP